ncbi:hypothetical protein C8J57DRAFT_1224827 [Mycena rebaudengoi]|nr:hypothetical protein C8J57DRAFT_1224827 [Mycena rebaudengoi]
MRCGRDQALLFVSVANIIAVRPLMAEVPKKEARSGAQLDSDCGANGFGVPAAQPPQWWHGYGGHAAPPSMHGAAPHGASAQVYVPLQARAYGAPAAQGGFVPRSTPILARCTRPYGHAPALRDGPRGAARAHPPPQSAAARATHTAVALVRRRARALARHPAARVRDAGGVVEVLGDAVPYYAVGFMSGVRGVGRSGGARGRSVGDAGGHVCGGGECGAEGNDAQPFLSHLAALELGAAVGVGGRGGRLAGVLERGRGAGWDRRVRRLGLCRVFLRLRALRLRLRPWRVRRRLRVRLPLGNVVRMMRRLRLLPPPLPLRLRYQLRMPLLPPPPPLPLLLPLLLSTSSAPTLRASTPSTPTSARTPTHTPTTISLTAFTPSIPLTMTSTASTAAPVPGRALRSLTTTLDATTHAEDIARLRVLDEGQWQNDDSDLPFDSKVKPLAKKPAKFSFLNFEAVYELKRALNQYASSAGKWYPAQLITKRRRGLYRYEAAISEDWRLSGKQMRTGARLDQEGSLGPLTLGSKGEHSRHVLRLKSDDNIRKHLEDTFCRNLNLDFFFPCQTPRRNPAPPFTMMCVSISDSSTRGAHKKSQGIRYRSTTFWIMRGPDGDEIILHDNHFLEELVPQGIPIPRLVLPSGEDAPVKAIRPRFVPRSAVASGLMIGIAPTNAHSGLKD